MLAFIYGASGIALIKKVGHPKWGEAKDLPGLVKTRPSCRNTVNPNWFSVCRLMNNCWFGVSQSNIVAELRPQLGADKQIK